MLDEEIISRRITFVSYVGNSGYTRAVPLTQELKKLGIEKNDGLLITQKTDGTIIIRKAYSEKEIIKNVEAQEKVETPPEPVEDDKVDNDSTSQ